MLFKQLITDLEGSWDLQVAPALGSRCSWAWGAAWHAEPMGQRWVCSDPSVSPRPLPLFHLLLSCSYQGTALSIKQHFSCPPCPFFCLCALAVPITVRWDGWKSQGVNWVGQGARGWWTARTSDSNLVTSTKNVQKIAVTSNISVSFYWKEVL